MVKIALRWGSYREIGEDLLAQLGFFVLVDFRAINVVEVTEISKETGHLMLWSSVTKSEWL